MGNGMKYERAYSKVVVARVKRTPCRLASPGCFSWPMPTRLRLSRAVSCETFNCPEGGRALDGGSVMQTKILIVEDEMPLAMLMVSVLTRFNCDVRAAHNGKKAMELATQNGFDLIILDIELPDTTGFEICSELKQRHISYKTPVIFISASPCQQDIDEAKKCGAVDYLPKPFDVTEFMYKVIYHARARRLMRHLPEGLTA